MSKNTVNRTSVQISKRTHKRIKIASAMSGITQKELVEKAIDEYLKKRAGLDKILQEEEE